MEYDSVLGQQSISGKNVSLILCVEALLCEIRSQFHNHLTHFHSWNQLSPWLSLIHLKIQTNQLSK